MKTQEPSPDEVQRLIRDRNKKGTLPGAFFVYMVETRGIEPLTS